MPRDCSACCRCTRCCILPLLQFIAAAACCCWCCVVCAQGGGCVRVDGRGLSEVRSISCQAGPLARTVHGSGLFSRGETQSLATATVGHDTEVQPVSVPPHTLGRPVSVTPLTLGRSVGVTSHTGAKGRTLPDGHSAVSHQQQGCCQIMPSTLGVLCCSCWGNKEHRLECIFRQQLPCRAVCSVITCLNLQ